MGMLVKVVVVGGTGSNSGFQKLSDPKNIFQKDFQKKDNGKEFCNAVLNSSVESYDHCKIVQGKPRNSQS